VIKSEFEDAAGADLVERLVHIGDDVETVEDRQGLGADFAENSGAGLEL
jgi:hypothetical protein